MAEKLAATFHPGAALQLANTCRECDTDYTSPEAARQCERDDRTEDLQARRAKG